MLIELTVCYATVIWFEVLSSYHVNLNIADIESRHGQENINQK